jgi:hypothetical protein
LKVYPTLFSLRLSAFAKKREHSRKDAEPPRLFDFSLRLFYFARKKKTRAKAQRRKGFNWLDCFSPLRVKKVLTQSLSTAGMAPSRKVFTLLVFFAPAFRRQVFPTWRD